MSPGLMVFVAFLCFLYVLPWYVAARRGHPQAQAIAVLTILLGWTLLGWVVALVWAFTAIPGEAERQAEARAARERQWWRDAPEG